MPGRLVAQHHGAGASAFTAVVVDHAHGNHRIVHRRTRGVVVLVDMLGGKGARRAGRGRADVGRAERGIDDGRLAITPVDFDLVAIVTHAYVGEGAADRDLAGFVQATAGLLRRQGDHAGGRVVDHLSGKGRVRADHVGGGDADAHAVLCRAGGLVVGDQVPQRKRGGARRRLHMVDLGRTVVPDHGDVDRLGRIGGREAHHQVRLLAFDDRTVHLGLQALGEAHVVEEEDLADQLVERRHAIDHRDRVLGQVVQRQVVVDHVGAGDLDLDLGHLALEALGHHEAVVDALHEAGLQRHRGQGHVGQAGVERGVAEGHLHLSIGRRHQRREDVEAQHRLVGGHQQAVVGDGVEVDDRIDRVLDHLRRSAAEHLVDQRADQLATAHQQAVVALVAQLPLEQHLDVLLQEGLQRVDTDPVHRFGAAVNLEGIGRLGQVRVDRITQRQQVVDDAGDRLVEGVEQLVRQGHLGLVVRVLGPGVLVPGLVARAAASAGRLWHAEGVGLGLVDQHADGGVPDLVEDLVDDGLDEFERVGLEDEQAGQVERAQGAEVEVESLAAMERPARQLVREWEAVLVAGAAQAPIQRLAQAVLEVTVEHCRHHLGAGGDLGVVEFRRVLRCGRRRRPKRRTAARWAVVPAVGHALPQATGCGVPGCGVELEARQVAHRARDHALVDHAAVDRRLGKRQDLRVGRAGIPLPDAAVRSTEAEAEAEADERVAGERRPALEIILREAGATVEQQAHRGAWHSHAIGRGCDCGAADAVGGAGCREAHAAGGLGLVVVVEEADVAPQGHVGVAEITVRDVQRDTEALGPGQE